jgi:hypothetical protein
VARRVKISYEAREQRRWRDAEQVALKREKLSEEQREEHRRRHAQQDAARRQQLSKNYNFSNRLEGYGNIIL